MATKTTEVIAIKPIEVERFTIRLVGDSPLIMHAWSEKAKREMYEAQQGKKKVKTEKERKNAIHDFVQSMYWLEGKPDIEPSMSDEESEEAFVKAIQNGARFGFPATAFKQAGNSAAYRMGWVKNQMGLRGAYFIEADEDGLVEIHSDVPEMREDMVKIGMGTADIRYRGMFSNWYADLTIQYNKNGQFSKSDVINILNAGGFLCGAGEWRPERDGQYGMYHVEATA